MVFLNLQPLCRVIRGKASSRPLITLSSAAAAIYKRWAQSVNWIFCLINNLIGSVCQDIFWGGASFFRGIDANFTSYLVSRGGRRGLRERLTEVVSLSWHQLIFRWSLTSSYATCKWKVAQNPDSHSKWLTISCVMQ